MKQFLDKDFLLNTEAAKILYHEAAEKQPIIDYHCHLNPQEIYEDIRYENITRVWLGGDHYKWRLMRSAGVPEKYITGDASDWEKFEKWAESVPYTVRNPLCHWTHLELKTAFGIDKLLSPKTAREIFDECNDKLLNDPNYTARGFMRRYNVECVCTTDDPVDDLRWHKATKESGFEIKMIPAWRPDKAMNIEKPEFAAYMQQLAEVSVVTIIKFADKYIEK